MPKKPVLQLLDELGNLVTNPEMRKWAQKLDEGAHGAKSAATNIRVNLAAVMKEAKAVRAEIQARRP